MRRSPWRGRRLLGRDLQRHPHDISGGDRHGNVFAVMMDAVRHCSLGQDSGHPYTCMPDPGTLFRRS